MKKDILLKRLYCLSGFLLGILLFCRDFRDMLAGKGFSTSTILVIVGTGAAVYSFFHPEKVVWKQVKKGLQLQLGVWLSAVGLLLLIVYLFLNLTLGISDNWTVVGIGAVMIIVGGLILFPRKKEGKEP